MKRSKIGIFGVGPRGSYIARDFMLLNCDIVAICDHREECLTDAEKRFGKDVAVYRDFDAFIEHDMDAVVLTNYFHEHAPYAIKCFKKGLHVYSECISNGTMADGVALVKAFEESNSIYMLAENYPQMKFNREIKRICDSGTLGKILYAEGEYVHPDNPSDSQYLKEYKYFEKHWRNYNPRAYYITHALGPIMRATGATPKKVTAFAVFGPEEGDVPNARYCGDATTIIMTQNNDGSVFRVIPSANIGGAHNTYRVCGTSGQIENLRGMGGQVMLRYNYWSKPEGSEATTLYMPEWNDKEDPEIFKNSGHGGSDYLTIRTFIECIREGRQPEHPFNVYSAVAMSSVAILGHRSMLEGGKPFDIPDFRKEEDCKLYENDYLSPFYGTDGSEPTLPCCSQTDFKPTEVQVEKYRMALGIN